MDPYPSKHWIRIELKAIDLDPDPGIGSATRSRQWIRIQIQALDPDPDQGIGCGFAPQEIFPPRGKELQLSIFYRNFNISISESPAIF